MKQMTSTTYHIEYSYDVRDGDVIKRSEWFVQPFTHSYSLSTAAAKKESLDASAKNEDANYPNPECMNMLHRIVKTTTVKEVME